MFTFEIESRMGESYGEFEAQTESGALDQLAHGLGFANWAELQAEMPFSVVVRRSITANSTVGYAAHPWAGRSRGARR